MKSFVSTIAIIVFVLIFTAIIGHKTAKLADTYANGVNSAYSILDK